MSCQITLRKKVHQPERLSMLCWLLFKRAILSTNCFSLIDVMLGGLSGKYTARTALLA